MKQANSNQASDSYPSNPRTSLQVAVKQELQKQNMECWSPVSVASSQSAASPYSSPMAIPQGQPSKPIDFIDQILDKVQKEVSCFSGYETHPPPRSSSMHQQCSDVDLVPRANALALAIHRVTPQINLPIESAVFSTMHDQAYDTAVMLGSIFESEWSAFSYHVNALPTPLRNYSMEFEKAIENETIWYQNDLNGVSSSLEIPSMPKAAGISSFSRNRPPSRVAIHRLSESKRPSSFSPDTVLGRSQQNYNYIPGFSSSTRSFENATEKDLPLPRPTKRGREEIEPSEGRYMMEDLKRIRLNAGTPISVTPFDPRSCPQPNLPRRMYSGKSLPRPSPSPPTTNTMETRMDQSHLFHSPVLVPGRRSKLPMRVVTHLRHFFLENIRHPYPNDNQKQILARETNLKTKQISDWFTNNRKRYYRTFEKHLISIKCQLANKRRGICDCGGKNNPPVHHWRMMWE